MLQPDPKLLGLTLQADLLKFRSSKFNIIIYIINITIGIIINIINIVLKSDIVVRLKLLNLAFI